MLNPKSFHSRLSLPAVRPTSCHAPTPEYRPSDDEFGYVGQTATTSAYRRGPSSVTKRRDSDASFPVLFDVTMQLVKIPSPPQPRDSSSGKFVARPK